MVRRLGNQQLGDSMNHVGRSMAKNGIKLGVTVAGAAGTAARSMARHAAEAAESFGDLVAEARHEMSDDTVTTVTASIEEPNPESAPTSKKVRATEVSVE